MGYELLAGPVGGPFASPFASQRRGLRLVETRLPVERFFVPRVEAASFAGQSASGRRKKVAQLFSREHDHVADRLTIPGRNFIRVLAELEGAALGDLQIINRTSQRPTIISLGPHITQPFTLMFLLVGPGDQGGVLTYGTGSVDLRAGDLWRAERGASSFRVQTGPGYSELLLFSVDSDCGDVNRPGNPGGYLV